MALNQGDDIHHLMSVACVSIRLITFKVHFILMLFCSCAWSIAIDENGLEVLMTVKFSVFNLFNKACHVIYIKLIVRVIGCSFFARSSHSKGTNSPSVYNYIFFISKLY